MQNALMLWLSDMAVRFGFWVEKKGHTWCDQIVAQCREAKKEGLSLYAWRKKHNVTRGGGVWK